MRPQSIITKFIAALLKRQKTPKGMKWIMDKVCEKYPNCNHAVVWNSVNNGCACPAVKPRFRRLTLNKKTLFEANR